MSKQTTQPITRPQFDEYRVDEAPKPSDAYVSHSVAPQVVDVPKKKNVKRKKVIALHFLFF